MSVNYKVYCHTNKANNKRYVGITKQKLNRRWRNGKGYREDTHFGRAIKKYGWDTFKHEVLFEGLSKEEAISKEIELISKWDLMNPLKGYNNTSGGENTTFSEDTVERMRKERKEYYQIPENYKKLVKQNRQRFIDDPTLVKRLSLAHIDLQVTPIYCTELDKEFKSIKEASKELHIHKNSICSALNGRQNTAGGYHFTYINEKDVDKCKCRRDKEHKIDREFREVLCVNTGKIYKTCREAEIDLGITKGKVSWVCNNPESTTKGYSFKYLREPIKIVCLTNSKVYKSAKEASEDLGVPSSRIGEVCRGSRKSVKGFVFQYLKEEDFELF